MATNDSPAAWPPERREGEGALEYRLRYEAEACEQECGASGCTNRATHTWSGHPTCDECALPGRKPLPFPVIR